MPPMPVGSAAVLFDPTAVGPHFKVDVLGDYRIQLVVNDGGADSAPDTVTVSTLNSPPVANAGPDQTVRVGDDVTLAGNGSTDVDGQPLTYRWALTPPFGSSAVLDDPAAAQPTFTVDIPGTYIGSVTVNDGFVDSAPDTVTVSTENSPPVANAGPDQSAFVGTTVTLDGSASSDVDGDPLSYFWSLSVPPGSGATLSDARRVGPSFDIDLPGSYVGQLIADDGHVASAPDTVTVSTENSRPLACIDAMQTALVGDLVSLDGTCSADADGDGLSYQWSIASSPEGGVPTLSGADSAIADLVPDLPGLYVVQLIVCDGTLKSVPITMTLTVGVALPPPNRAPQIASTPVTVATVGQPYAYDVEANDADGDALTYSLLLGPGGMGIDPATGLLQWTPGAADLAASPVAVSVQVADGHGGADTQSFAIAVQGGTARPLVPALIGLTKTAAQDAIAAAHLSLGAVDYRHDAIAPDGQVIDQSPAAGTPADLGAPVDLAVSLGPDAGLPPNPETVAPPLDPRTNTTLADATEFLYTGDHPVQTGVAPGTIEARRAAVIRGKVYDRGNNPLPGVAIAVLDHPELGRTLSRADGAFDLAVNGGGVLTLVYEKAGYLPAQRQVQTPWQDYAFAPDLILVGLDPEVTAIDLTAPAGVQVARGSRSSDADGTRQATLLFPAGTTAQMVLPNGATQSLASLHVRATEYTIGADGPKAMPAALPPTSGYTYAVEIGADEAIAAGATSVVLSRPVPLYVENFLGFPVGTAVPLGWYDRQKGQWIAAPNGRVIRVVGISAGLAELDIDGDGSPDAEGALAALGIDAAERAKLAELYGPGQSLWRVPLDHFTPWDCNWPYGPPPGAQPPTESEAKPEEPDLKDDPCTRSGSTIGCETQTLGEAVQVTGTPLRLHYQSERTFGYRAGRSLNVTLTEAEVPPGLKRVELSISVAGRRVAQSFAPTPNQHMAYTWDGRDAFGRAVQGSQKATVTVSYLYSAVFYAAREDFERSFALASGSGASGSGALNPIVRQGSEIGLEQTSNVDLEAGSPDGEPVAGWSLSAHHRWDAARGVLVRGDGSEIRAAAVGPVIATVAGNGSPGFAGDGGPAVAARLRSPEGVAVAADGSLYIADTYNHRIRRVGPDGRIATVAGSGAYGFSGDGSLYIADYYNHRIRRVGPDGIIATVAGNGIGGFSGDGSLYIADYYNGRIRRVGPDGIIATVAGSGTYGNSSGDGGPAVAAMLRSPKGVAVAADGSLYVVDYLDHRIRRVGPDGIIATVAGSGTYGFSGDGGPATAANLYWPIGVAVAADGSLYIADYYNQRIRRVGPDGIIATVAGNGIAGFSGDGGPATAARLYWPRGVAVAADGSLYIVDDGNQRIRRIAAGASGLSQFVPSADGTEVYEFDLSGRHLRTLDALTGGTLYAFGYDTAGRLISIADGSGNLTRIERDGAGNPTALLGPYGQRTAFTLDASGYLASIANPAGETYRMAYTADGLLTRFEDPRGNASTMAYDDLGRLVRDADAAGGSQSLTRAVLSDPPGWEVRVATAEGATTAYRVEDLPIGSQQRTVTAPDGTRTLTVTGTDGKTTRTGADGSVLVTVEGPDPRFGMAAPVTTSETFSTPGGLVLSLTQARTASLTDPSNPLSLVSLTDTLTRNGRTATRVYQTATRTATHTSAAGRVSTTAIDALGRPSLTQTAGLEPVAYAYDARGRLETLTQGSGDEARTLTLAYDPEGHLASLTDALGRRAGLAYDLAGRLTAQTLPDGQSVLFDHDPKGNLTALIPPGRPEHGFAYTPVDLTREYTPPQVGAGSDSTRYSYDLDKHLTQLLRPDGQTADLAYDAAGRLATLSVPEGAFHYGYDPVTGHLTQIAAPDGGTLGFAYDGPLLTGATWTGAVAGSVAFAYDNDLRLARVSLDGADLIAYAYDPDGLLVQAGALTLSRDAQNGLLTGTALGTLADTRTYNGFGEPASYTAAWGATALLAIAYTRDPLGRLVERTDTLGGLTTTQAYAYDLAGRLVEVSQDGLVQTTFGYDANGNRTHENGTEIAHYDAQDRLLDYEGATYAYTANGELETKTQGSQLTRYAYDVLGNLRQVTLPNGTVIDYLTDGRNRRIGKKVNGILVQGFLYQDQLKPVAELDGAGNLVSRFVYATRANVPDYLIKGGATYRLLTDHLGSPRLVVDTATGAVAQRLDYDAWGRVTRDTHPGFQPFGFAGGLYDRDAGLVRFGARDYDPETGRWTGKDPIRFDGGVNLYSYVGGNPLSYTDPLGLARGDWWDPRTYLPDYDRARQIANEELALHHGHNDADDAQRHSEWSCRMAKEIGPFTAWSAGTGHELDNLLHGGPLRESLMDLHNNAEGRNAASQGRPIDPSNLRTDPAQSSGAY